MTSGKRITGVSISRINLVSMPYPLFSVALLLALFVCVLSARAAHAQPVDAGEEPAGRPIVYNLIPAEDAIVAQDKLGRAGATIETQRDAGVAWAAIFVDGQKRPSALMGPTSYYQSISTDIGGLEPGIHTVWVIAIDGEGCVGGYAWTFTII
jgi:hypothetical protein